MMLSVSAGGVVLFSISLQGLFELVPSTVSLVRRLPWWFQLGAVASMAVALLHPTSRRWLKTHFGPFFTRIFDGVQQVSEVSAALLTELGEATEAAQEWLAEVERKDPPMTTDLSAVIRVLATTPSRHLMTPTGIAHRMMAAGYKPRSAHPEIAVGRILHRHQNLFVQQARGRWQLRRA